MYQITLKNAVNDEAGILPMEYVGSRIYAIRDGETVLYVGQSVDPVYRIQQHLGYERKLPSGIGKLILVNRPESDEWTIDCYRLEDCRPIFEQYFTFPDEQMRKVLINIACVDVDRAERSMIKILRPCLNSTHNEYPNALPGKYRRIGEYLAIVSQ